MGKPGGGGGNGSGGPLPPGPPEAKHVLMLKTVNVIKKGAFFIICIRHKNRQLIGLSKF